MQEKNMSSHSCNPKLFCEAAVRDVHSPNSKSLGIFSVKEVFSFIQALEGFAGCQICSQRIAQVCSVSCVMQSSREAGQPCVLEEEYWTWLCLAPLLQRRSKLRANPTNNYWDRPSGYRQKKVLLMWLMLASKMKKLCLKQCMVTR